MTIVGCGNSAPVPGVVVFDPVAFVAAFPEFATLPQPALQFNFLGATQLLNNTCRSVVKDAPTREYLLMLATAHITKLLNGSNGEAPSGIVGRIDSAAQGSVKVNTEYTSAPTANEAYFAQTQYGAMFWKMTAQYRTMRYYVPPRRDYNNLYGYGVGSNPFIGDFGNGDGNGC